MPVAWLRSKGWLQALYSPTLPLYASPVTLFPDRALRIPVWAPSSSSRLRGLAFGGSCASNKLGAVTPLTAQRARHPCPSVANLKLEAGASEFLFEVASVSVAASAGVNAKWLGFSGPSRTFKKTAPEFLVNLELVAQVLFGPALHGLMFGQVPAILQENPLCTGVIPRATCLSQGACSA